VDAAKSGVQDVRVGEVFVECAGKTGFPGFGFSGKATTTPCGAEDGSRRKNCNLQNQRMASGRILIGIRDLKWKILIIACPWTDTRDGPHGKVSA
jgi:hypothetical protein